MSEHPDDIHEPEGNRQGRSVRMIFAVLITMLLSLVLSWFFVPSVRVLGYQSILVVGSVDARKWSLEKLEGYKELAVKPISIALTDVNPSIRLGRGKGTRKDKPRGRGNSSSPYPSSQRQA